MARLERKIKQAMKPVQPPFGPDKRARTTPLPPQVTVEPVDPEDVELTEEEKAERIRQRARGFKTLEVTSTKGKKYKIVVPSSTAKAVPRVWEWTAQRYEAANMIAEGFPISHVADALGIGSRLTIYGWLEHPEFREHVDALISETSYASHRERVAGLTRMTRVLYDKLIREIERVPLTDKSVGAIISGIQNGLKQLAQEKGEFVEQQAITQQTSITGSIGVATVDVDNYLRSKTAEEREALEREFDKMADDIIRNLTGAK